VNPKPEVLFDAEAIARRVAKMGAEISAAYDGRDLCVVGIMKSCLVFMADLIRQIQTPTTCHFLRSTSVREEVAG
jgi:hypoxanthine phosphoribosyltransferase